MTMKTDELNTLQAAREASLATSLEIWEQQGRKDSGACGGAIMLLDGRSKLAKVALANGFARDVGGDIFVNNAIANGVNSQSGYLYKESLRSFRGVIEAAGYGKSVKKFWTYID
jgi:hypothetical protein